MQIFSKYTHINTLETIVFNCHMVAVDPNDVIYCKANWVVEDLTYTIYMKRLESPATKFNLILNLVYFYTVLIKNKVFIVV